MGAAVKDWYDLLRELDQHPEWREELRRLVLTEDLLTLPEGFRRLQALVEKLAATVERLGQRVEELAEAQKRTEEVVAGLSRRMDELAEAQKRTDQKVAELAEAQKRTEEALAGLSRRTDELAEAQKRTEETLAVLSRRMDELAEAQKRTEEALAGLSRRTDQLAEAQTRTEETLAVLSRRVDELAEAQKRTEEALAALSRRVDELAQALRRTEEKVAELAAAQHRTENRVEELANAVKVLVGHVDHLRGWSLEYRYQRHAPAYLGPLLRRIHVLTPEELATLVEDAEDSGLLEAKEATSLLQADVVCSGHLQKDRERKVWAVVEVSWVVGEEDIKRAAERAEALRKIVAEPVIPVAAGNHISDEVAAFAAMQRVYTLIGRTVTAPEEYRSGLNLLTS